LAQSSAFSNDLRKGGFIGNLKRGALWLMLFAFLGKRAPVTVECPSCHSCACRRSRRRGIEDFVYAVVGLIPWRCSQCERRFRARPVPLNHWKYAHCSICGNLDLKRISPEHVPGTFGGVGRLLGLPSLRCEPCRHKFFSLRPLKQLAPQESQTERQRVA